MDDSARTKERKKEKERKNDDNKNHPAKKIKNKEEKRPWMNKGKKERKKEGWNQPGFDPALDQETGASGRGYQGITLTVDGLNWEQMWRPQETGGLQTII